MNLENFVSFFFLNINFLKIETQLNKITKNRNLLDVVVLFNKSQKKENKVIFLNSFMTYAKIYCNFYINKNLFAEYKLAFSSNL